MIFINNRPYTRVRSDAGLMIERNGALYEEAVDPIGSDRTYVETDRPITGDPGVAGHVAAPDALTQH